MSQPLGFKTIRTNILRDIKNQQPQAIIDDDSNHYVRANATASAVEGNYQHQEWVLDQGFADTADIEYLERHCAIHGIYRKAATLPGGDIKFTGTPGALVPAGTIVQTVAEQIYTTTENINLDHDGVGIAYAIGQYMEVTANLPPDTPASLTSAPVSIDGDCLILTMTGGTKQESPEALLDRYLNKLRHPPAGGNAHDYYTWAMDVDGVTAAYVYSLRRGLGTVDIVIISNNSLPNQEIIEACQKYIDNVRPVTAKDSLVLAPNVRNIDIRIQRKLIAVADQDATDQAINVAVEHYFDGLKPAQDFIKSQLEADISNVYNVLDRSVIQPTANIEAVVNAETIDWLRVGQIDIRDML